MSNDYLGIADHPAILRTQADTLVNHGNGLIMSGVFLNTEAPHRKLEQELASHLRAQSTIICQSGWCANVGLIQTIADDTVPVYIDIQAHMSLWEGIRSAGARARPFRHNDPDHLQHLIRRHGSGVIVVDSVYSTDGSVCPLREIVAIGTANRCLLVVDESHSLGTHGPRGAGLSVELGLADRIHFRTASLAKAFAARAGLITCSEPFAEYFRYTALPAIFSSSLLPHEVAGLRAALIAIRKEEWRRRKLQRNAARLRAGLLELGYNVSASQSQILALEAGPEQRTFVLREALETRDVFGSVFCAPATPGNRSLIRFSVNALLDDEDLDQVLDVCAEIRKTVDLAAWPSTRRLQRRLEAA